MKYLFVLFLCFGVGVGSAQAYIVTQFTPSAPYEIYVIDGFPEVERVFLGDLQNFPEMYQIESDVAFLLTVSIDAVPSEATPLFSGIVIREVVGGVEEVARLRAAEAGWELTRDDTTRLPKLTGPAYQAELPAGTYRIEVSTPDNQGQYVLTVGHTRTSEGYFSSLRNIAATYEWYGYGILNLLRVPLVFYPLGIIVLLGLILGTWYWRRYR